LSDYCYEIMKKVVLFCLILFLSCNFGYAIKELKPVELQINTDENGIQIEEKSFLQKYLTDYEKNDPLRFHIEKGPVKELKLGVVYDGQFDLKFLNEPSETHLLYENSYVDTSISGKFRNDKTSFKVMVNPVRTVKNYKYIGSLWQDIWVKHEFNKNQSVTVGYYRTPNGMEGSISSYIQDFNSRSQIARTFANARATGIRNTGTYKYFDYDIGVFDSARYFDSCLKGVEFIAKATAKPLASTDGKYSSLKVGSSINTGKRDNSYFVANGFLAYKYKKIGIDVEYAHANGYNGAYISSNKEAQGVYATIKYNLIPKIDLLFRYDLFDPDMKVANNNVTEYTVGLNYQPVKDRLLFMLNYVFKDAQKSPNSSAIILSTQIAI